MSSHVTVSMTGGLSRTSVMSVAPKEKVRESGKISHARSPLHKSTPGGIGYEHLIPGGSSCYTSGQVHDSAPNGHCNRFCSIMYGELCQDVLHVSLGGFFADAQLGGNLFVP